MVAKVSSHGSYYSNLIAVLYVGWLVGYIDFTLVLSTQPYPVERLDMCEKTVQQNGNV